MIPIKTQEDWWETAKEAIPLLPDYMRDFNGGVDEDKVLTTLNALLETQNHAALHGKFEEIWAWLPDRPDIRRRPFFSLCDLCSEYWVFKDEQD